MNQATYGALEDVESTLSEAMDFWPPEYRQDLFRQLENLHKAVEDEVKWGVPEDEDEE